MPSPLDRIAITGTATVPPNALLTGVADIDALVGPEERPERQVLLRAAAMGVFCRAGVIAGSAPAQGVAPGERRLACSPGVAAIIGEMIDTSAYRVALVDVTAELDRRGLRVPNTLLPRLLAPSAKSALDTMAPVLGERLSWLGRLAPDWAPASTSLATADDAALQAIFQTGQPQERVDALHRLRTRDPDAARDLLAGCIRSEAAQVRVRLLSCLQTALSSADEELLEATLTDRSAAVRAEAARLLRRLPHSAHLARMRTLADSCLRWQAAAQGLMSRLRGVFGGGGPSGKLEVILPAEFDAAWEREGLTEAPPSGVGPRVHWMMQMVSAVPPSTWSTAFAATPAAIVASALDSEHAGGLVQACLEAALAYGDDEWIVACTDVLLQGSDAHVRAGSQHLLGPALASLPTESAADLALRLIARDPTRLEALRQLPAPWPTTVGDTFLRTVLSHPAALAMQTDLLRHAAVAIDPRSLERVPLRQELPPASPQLPEYTRSALVSLCTLLELRLRFHKELDRDHPQS